MIHQDVELLEIKFRIQVKQALMMLRLKEIPFYVVETFREQIVQDAYYAQGRQPLIAVNSLRQKAGIYMLSESENKIITQTTHSKHSDGRAIDIAPMKDGKIWWTAPIEKWEEIAFVMESYPGIAWGGRWKSFQDCPHYEAVK